LLTDDGTALTPHMAQLLSERGWQVVVLSFPQALLAHSEPLPAGVQRVLLPDMQEASLAQTLQSIAAAHGPIGGCIHLHPHTRQAGSSGISFSEVEKAVVQHVFLLARYLQPSLNEAAQRQWACFVTVARLDGAFGLGQEETFGAVGGGLFGLTKTLNLEWEPVFCRAIDLSAHVGPQQAAQHILAELHDPNRMLTEVGYSEHGRSTLVAL
jgi:NAD(P)-dependent dehydrogenase (short-subunit alcohol dehydrogenase family)